MYLVENFIQMIWLIFFTLDVCKNGWSFICNGSKTLFFIYLVGNKYFFSSEIMLKLGTNNLFPFRIMLPLIFFRDLLS